MKVSASALSDSPASEHNGMPRPVLWRHGAARFGALVAAVYLAAHLPSLAPSLEDIDSINFGLGLHDYDPAKHQPHPPGYPVYMAMGRGVLIAVRSVAGGLDPSHAEAIALAILSAIGGAVALVAATVFFSRLTSSDDDVDDGRSRAVANVATVLIAACPLFWMTGHHRHHHQ